MTVEKWDDGRQIPITGTVGWQVTSDKPDLQGNVWNRTDTHLHGLEWVDSAVTPVDGSGITKWDDDKILGSYPTTTTGYLADVVGSRKITVTVTVDGEPPATASFTFGKGPLWAFSKTGTSGQLWATMPTDNTSGGFQDPTNSFLAEEVCDGTVNNENVKVNTNFASGIDDIGIDGNRLTGWSDEEKILTGSYTVRYVKTSRMAKTEQLLAVSVYTNNSWSYPKVQRKGAAAAAGWSLGVQNIAWTGEVYYANNSYFVAMAVFLDDGYVDWYPVYHDITAVCRSFQ
jgi:hypothetical protein